MWPDRRIQDLFGIELPIIQAPMAGSVGSEMVIAVSEAGGLGSLPCAMLSPEQMRNELGVIRQRTSRPINLNFFCHQPPQADPAREDAWKQRLESYYVEFGLDPQAPVPAAARAPFDSTMCDLVEEFRPEVVSFHFGLPERSLLDRVRATGAKIISSATTVDEARWLERSRVRCHHRPRLRGRWASRGLPIGGHLHPGRHDGIGAAGCGCREGARDRRRRHRRWRGPLLQPSPSEPQRFRSERLICSARKPRSAHSIARPSREQRTTTQFSRTCSPVGLLVGSSTASSVRSARCRTSHRHFHWPPVRFLRSGRRRKPSGRATFRPCGRDRLRLLVETFRLATSHGNLAWTLVRSCPD